MNINEFELNYLLVQKDIKTGNRTFVLDLFERLATEEHDEKVCYLYREQISSIQKGYVNLILAQSKELKDKHLYRESLNQCSKILDLTDSSELFLLLAQDLAHIGYTDLALAYLYRVNPQSQVEKAYFWEVAADISYQNKEVKTAIDYLKKSIEIEETKDKLYRLATYYITAGDFENGGKYYVNRFLKETNPAKYPDLKIPLWKGQKVKSILVHWEQGFGDTIMFCRFLKDLKNYADEIYVADRKPMLRLLQHNFDFVHVIDESRINVKCECHVPIMSIPFILGKKVSDIDSCPYLVAERKVHPGLKKKVGFSWQGAPAGMPERNMSLMDLIPIIERKDLQLYSFQKGIGLANASGLFSDLNIVDLGSTFNDFYDTACALLDMDLFISTDNCLANLAGALGVPTILFLHSVPEHRWMNSDDKTIWYNSVKIIKQKNAGDWSSCVNEANLSL